MYINYIYHDILHSLPHSIVLIKFCIFHEWNHENHIFQLNTKTLLVKSSENISYHYDPFSHSAAIMELKRDHILYSTCVVEFWWVSDKEIGPHCWCNRATPLSHWTINSTYSVVLFNNSIKYNMILHTKGPWFNIKMLPYQYRKSHCGDKMVTLSPQCDFPSQNSNKIRT